ncbi:MAG: hypothetical protein QY328_18290 [Anaerolineales bacterium]|nr:hypothetical protein [Anaerolineales bacterium]WKZ40211.1 MAG: hypothetical protein QY328_18290 [Anaerolineales bacterium]
MPTLQLTPEELQLLKDVLENDLSDLRMEITHTDGSDFKDSLKQRKHLMADILEKLQNIQPVAAG